MVVIQFGARTVKGYLDDPGWNTVEELLCKDSESAFGPFRLRHLESDIVEEIPAENVKAVFYVNSFEGNAGHKDLNFHSHAPTVDGIWMRLQFRDGEVMEGIVCNSLQYLIAPGFFMLPTDPGSNNKLVYVIKSWIVDHRVLGIRKIKPS